MKQRGFTIVELLIVIVVIGILAAIVIVAFNGVQERAVTTTVKSDLANIHKQLRLFRVDSPADSYPTNAELSSIDIKISKNSYFQPTDRNQFYYCLSQSGQTYAVGAITKNNKGFMLVDGTITEVGTSASVYGGPTCVAAGWASGSGSPASGWTSTTGWANWVKG